MIAYLEEMLTRLFGARDVIALRVRADEETAKSRLMKGRK